MATDKPQTTKDEITAGLDGAPFETFHNAVLLAIYMAPEKTKGGIIRPDRLRDEDRWQGKVGLVVNKGPLAFKSEGGVSFENDVQVGDWVMYRVSDGFAVDINGVHCRVVEDVHIRAKVGDPEIIY